ncbi:NPCBM/NEW2 domain-containing protein [Streptomyces cyaneofuscatus]|uniref:NPCBM/NEW2 domain-containing protein n=1 Tax=Streptomyces cyaneofuscatus TaxID=66883 RepID=UPI00341A643F
MSSALPPEPNIPPRPADPPGPGGTPPSPRRLADVAALVSAGAAVVGLLVGFFGLPPIVSSPTARNVTVTTTVTETVYVKESVPPSSSGELSPSPSSPDPTPGLTSEPVPQPESPESVLLTDLEPEVLGGFSVGAVPGSVTMGKKYYPDALIPRDVCRLDIVYSINEKYKKLTAVIGLDDDSWADPVTISFIGDGKKLRSVTADINRPRAISLDVSGVALLGVTGDSSCGVEGHKPALGNPKLHP